ncbi:hypothetical protein GQ457_14G001400 [Hibiscus cannabinus]
MAWAILIHFGGEVQFRECILILQYGIRELGSASVSLAGFASTIMVLIEALSADSLSSNDLSSSIFANKNTSVRLDDDNFLLWKQQVLFLIHGHGLEHFLDESTVVPPKTLVNTVSWLLSTMSLNVLPQLVGAETSTTFWKAMLNLYAQLTTTKIMLLHYRLRSLKKGTLSMRNFVTQVKEVCDLLTTLGSKVSEIEQVATILNGLSAEYDPFVAVITGSKEPYTLDSTVSVLVDVETRLMDPLRLPVGINLAQHSVSSTIESHSNGSAANRLLVLVCIAQMILQVIGIVVRHVFNVRFVENWAIFFIVLGIDLIKVIVGLQLIVLLVSVGMLICHSSLMAFLRRIIVIAHLIFVIIHPFVSMPVAPNAATNNSHDEHREIAVIDSSKSVLNTVANGDDEHTEFTTIGSSPTMPLTAISNGRDEHIEFTSIESHRPNLLNEVQPEHLELPCDNLAPVVMAWAILIHFGGEVQFRVSTDTPGTVPILQSLVLILIAFSPASEVPVAIWCTDTQYEYRYPKGRIDTRWSEYRYPRHEYRYYKDKGFLN